MTEYWKEQQRQAMEWQNVQKLVMDAFVSYSQGQEANFEKDVKNIFKTVVPHWSLNSIPFKIKLDK